MERPEPLTCWYERFPVKVVRMEPELARPALPFHAFSRSLDEYLGVCLKAFALLASLVLFLPAYGFGLAMRAPHLGRVDLLD